MHKTEGEVGGVLWEKSGQGPPAPCSDLASTAGSIWSYQLEPGKTPTHSYNIQLHRNIPGPSQPETQDDSGEEGWGALTLPSSKSPEALLGAPCK